MSQAQVGFVKGTKPRFKDETRDLLRSRLLAACVVLVAILSLAFVGNLLQSNEKGEYWWIRLSILVALVGAVYVLRFYELTIKQLCAVELVVFAVICVQLVLMMVIRLLKYADLESAAAGIASVAAVRGAYLASFCILVLAYGIFIPNSWKRGLAIIIPMAVLPYAVLAILIATNQNVADAFDTILFASPLPVTLMAAAVAIYGTRVINVVRREAFKARQFGQYRLGKKLGSGGMGEVYEAEHVLLKRPCAIKLIRPESESDARALASFEKEVKATAKLTHWNTVEIFDYGHTDDGTFYYVMELLPGLSLHELVERFGPLDPGRVVYLLLQLCDALAEAHSMGLIHRDIKPANIFVSQRGRKFDVAKLLDFGLVKEHATEAGAESHGFSGTPDYMSPEQATAYDEVDAASDIYSLACVAYFALTGQPPFPNENVMEALNAHAQQQAQLLSQVRASIPADLEQVIARCLKKKPVNRFDSADALAKALRQCECRESWTEESAADWWQSHAPTYHSPTVKSNQLDATCQLDETIHQKINPPTA